MRPVNFHIAPEGEVDVVVDEIRTTVKSLIAEGVEVDIVVTSPDHWVPVSEAAAQLGFSRQHARRLIDAGLLAGRQQEGSSYWQVSQRSIAELLAKREDGWRRTGEWSKALDDLGVPFE
ncbi:helix-turn-helix domain-containing protein [Conexibacter woesei]|uniref:helix-turn-helix domain-containing protein n=1 Tax=Conexibacter woesei TaxID=191495 RepID=UPI00041138E9|nr:helix-turn-helix domain-containing protein [Conexibacter woesei]